MKKALYISIAAFVLVIMGLGLADIVIAIRSGTFWYPNRESKNRIEKSRAITLPSADADPAMEDMAISKSCLTNPPPAQKKPGQSAEKDSESKPAASAQAALPARPRTPFRVLIDAGHIKEEPDEEKGIVPEYVLTYKTSKYLLELLKNDGRFSAEISRGPERYDWRVLGSERIYEGYIRGILKEFNPLDKRSAWVGGTERTNLYGLRYYALSHGFDCVLSVHYDKVVRRSERSRSKGFHVLVSPCNREYPRSLAFAMSLKSSMQKKYRINPLIYYNDLRIFPRERRAGIDPVRLKTLGISVRSVMVLGDIYEYQYFRRIGGFPFKDIPSVLVECGFVHERQFASDEGVKAVARQLYEGIASWYEKEHPQMNIGSKAQPGEPKIDTRDLR